MRVSNLEQIVDALKGHRDHLEEPASHAQIVDAALPRILATLELVPEGRSESHLLELGSEPYLMSLVLDCVWSGRITHANYRTGDEAKGSATLVGVDGRPARHYAFDRFDVERDEFPYADGTFDVVVFSEMIEHLAVNPVWALSEVHRVLKRDGSVIITTPNALSLDRLAIYLRGGSAADDRYSPAFGYGARHNREYHAAELRALLESTGFTIEAMVVRDLGAHLLRRSVRVLAKLLLRLWSSHPREAHIFLRARRGERFHWRFPPALFGHLETYCLVRHPFMEVGVNDAIQCGAGWRSGVETTDRGAARRLHTEWLEQVGPSIAYLRGMRDGARVLVRLRAGAAGSDRMVAGTVTVTVKGGGGAPLAERCFELRSGEWQDVAVRLARPTAEREELEVRLAVGRADVVVQRIWLEA